MGMECFSPCNFPFKKKLCQLNSTLALWFSKSILLYGGNSVKFDIFKHVSLQLSVISKCYFSFVFCFWYGQIVSLFFIVSDVFRKIKIFSFP